MVISRWAVAVLGILLPYMARIPGTIERGPTWFTSFLGGPGLVLQIGATLFIGAFNSILWGGILGFSLLFKHPFSLWMAAALGFVYPAYEYGRLDLAEDAQSALGLIFIPIYGVVFVFLGGLLGWVVDSLISKCVSRQPTASGTRS